MNSNTIFFKLPNQWFWLRADRTIVCHVKQNLHYEHLSYFRNRSHNIIMYHHLINHSLVVLLINREQEYTL